jgi:hypothetical protein
MKFILTLSIIAASLSLANANNQHIDPLKPLLHKTFIKIDAHNLDFNLVNMTGYTIRDVYVAPTTQREWGEDIMGREFLEAGETVEITFDGGETETLWDIYITWEGYDPSEDRYWIGLDLSEISEVALYYDAETGKTWTKIK